ncbi:MAG: zinc-binding dehydrogenase [Lacisediminihabitans sp.]
MRFIPGSVARSGKAVAGTIDAVGVDVIGFAPGDRVASLGEARNIAEPRLLDSENLIGIPRDVSGEQAAALLPQGLVARVLVKETHAVGGGETVLVHAASGLLGSLIVAWAKSLGATVIATVGSTASAGAAILAGADQVIVFSEEDVAGRVAEITGGRGVDVVYDGVGTATTASSLASLRHGGHLVQYGRAAELPLPQDQDITVLRPRLADHLRAGSIQQGASDLFLAIRSGVFAGVDASRFATDASTVALAA